MYDKTLAALPAIEFDHTNDQNVSFDWRVTVYGRSGKTIANWRIDGRTDREAEKEASSEVDRMEKADDWTMDPIARS